MMIGLTRKSDNAWVLVNTDHIVFFSESDSGGTGISLSHGYRLEVLDTMTEIIDKLDTEDYEG
jgi:hypothetical protein